MNKMLLTLFSLLGPALASTTVQVPVDASVSSVCVFFSQPVVDTSPPEGQALATTASPWRYTLQCTRGTVFQHGGEGTPWMGLQLQEPTSQGQGDTYLLFPFPVLQPLEHGEGAGLWYALHYI